MKFVLATFSGVLTVLLGSAAAQNGEEACDGGTKRLTEGGEGGGGGERGKGALMVSGENAGAIAFHEAIGFTRAGVLPEAGYKFGRWMDLVLFHKHP